jgi:hypothetical protein
MGFSRALITETSSDSAVATTTPLLLAVIYLFRLTLNPQVRSANAAHIFPTLSTVSNLTKYTAS